MVQPFHQDEYGNHLQITGGLPQVRAQITKQWLTSLMEQEEDNNQCFQFSKSWPPDPPGRAYGRGKEGESDAGEISIEWDLLLIFLDFL